MELEEHMYQVRRQLQQIKFKKAIVQKKVYPFGTFYLILMGECAFMRSTPEGVARFLNLTEAEKESIQKL